MPIQAARRIVGRINRLNGQQASEPGAKCLRDGSRDDSVEDSRMQAGNTFPHLVCGNVHQA